MCYIGYLAILISIVLYDCCILNGGIAHMPIALAHSFVVLASCPCFFRTLILYNILWSVEHSFSFLFGRPVSEQ